jgi:hypothetical protein
MAKQQSARSKTAKTKSRAPVGASDYPDSDMEPFDDSKLRKRCKYVDGETAYFRSPQATCQYPYV